MNISYKFCQCVVALGLVCFTLALLGCSEDSNRSASGEGRATITVFTGKARNIDSNLGDNIGKTSLADARAVSGLPSIITHLDVSVLEGEKVHGSGNILQHGVLLVQVPAGVELTVTGIAYAGSDALFQGQATVEPLNRDANASVSLRLTPIGALTGKIIEQPIQVDITAAGDRGDLTSNVDPWFAFYGENKNVLFTANSTNLSQNDTNGVRDIFSRALISGEIANLHTNDSGALADIGVIVADISADGKYAVFTSDASNLVADDTNQDTDLFIKNMQTGAVTRITETNTGGQVSGVINAWPHISGDGERVVIKLSSGTGSAEAIYIYDRTIETNQSIGQGQNPVISGDGKFIAFLRFGANENLELVRYEIATEQSSAVDILVFEAGLKAISRDGRYVAFLTMDSLNGNKIQRHDFTNNETLTASVDNNGNILNMASISPDDISPSIPGMSADGRYITFGLGTNSYVKDMQGNGELKVTIGAMWPALSPDGEILAYLSTDNNDALFVAANPALNLPGLLLDSDGDAIPDYWEASNGLDLSDPGDALLDNDLDGLSNLVEFQQRTNPGIANQYNITEIVDIANTVPTAIDDNGNVVGNSCGNNCQSITGFSWNETNGLVILNTNVGGVASYSVSLNDISNGVAVGSNRANNFTPGFAFNWRFASSSANSFSSRVSIANGINSTGQIAGQHYPVGSTNWMAVLWEELNDVMTPIELGTLGGDTSVAYSLNDQGQVVGTSKNSAGDNKAFLWQAEDGMTDLGTLGGKISTASDINNNGNIVGSASYVNINNVIRTHAFLWSAAKGMQDLGTVGGVTSMANAINDSSQVVGSSSDVAFIWANNQMIDLNTLLPVGSNVIIKSASDINNKGEIVASGLKIVDGEQVTNIAVLLKPSSPSITVALSTPVAVLR